MARADFHAFGDGELDHLALVVVPVERQAQQRIAQMVLVGGIEVHEVIFVGDVLAGKS